MVNRFWLLTLGGDSTVVASRTSGALGATPFACLSKTISTLVELLKSEGVGQIAVVDVDAKYTAVVGDNLMKFAYENNWAGIVINGYVRDTKNTKEIDVGLFALGTCPKKTMEVKEGSLHDTVSFGGITFNEGDYLYADRDGIIVSAMPLEM